MIKKSFASLLAILLLCFPLELHASDIYTLRDASGALTAGETAAAVSLIGRRAYTSASVFLDVTTLTLPDADDKVCFYLQTTYDDTNWTDIESICFTNADDGTTAKKILTVDATKDGPGSIQASIGTDPAVAAEISETVPANTIWRITTMEVTLATDASDTVRVQIDIDDGVFGHYAAISESTQAVSTTEVYIVGTVGITRSSIAGVHVIPLPPSLLLPAGHTISTLGVTSGDNWAAPHWIMEVWHDPSSSTDGTIGDNLKSYDRPLGTQIRMKTTVTGASAPTYAYSVRGDFR